MLRVRRARPADSTRIAELAALFGEYQREECKLDAEKIVRDGFGRKRAFWCHVAELNGSVVGYALVTPWYEPAAAARGLYVADLFVCEHARRQGVGRELLRTVCIEALERRCVFVGWLSKDWNELAHEFYRGTGAVHDPVVAHALFGEALTVFLGNLRESLQNGN